MYSNHENLLQKILSSLALLVVVFWPSQNYAATEISNFRYWSAPDHTRIVFDIAAEPEYQFNISGNTIALEFSNATLHASLPAEKIIGKRGIDKIIFTTANDNQCKIDIILDKPLKADVFKLKKFMDKPDRVVVDILMEQVMKQTDIKKRTPTPPTAFKKRVIVIDPGHGGDDPGAIGKTGTYEKDLVLAISREIKKEIDKMPGYRAVLTRDGDYYVSFNKRLNVARQTNASLFISVHADAARNRDARGSSIYCLSTGAASNEAAKLLANNENLSDIIGGVPSREGNNQSDEIILNMFQTNTINLSKTFASDLIDQIGRVQDLKYPAFQEAPFRVLKLPDTPAVLLETAFISNPQEEQMLLKSSFRKMIASAVASSVADYFSDSTFVASNNDAGTKENSTTIASKKTSAVIRPVKTIIYLVKRGDNMAAIAKRHETSLAALLKLNKIKMNDPLYVGRKILVPVVEPETVGSRPLKKYTVKKGETLFSLAKDNSMTIDELRRLNNMTDSDVLLSGQRIKLPK